MAIPNFQIVGATKCATSSLHYWLSQHKDFCMSEPKESPFVDVEYQKGIEHYSKYFPSFEGQDFIGDANPNVFVLPWAAERIKKINPETKIIICLREPAERCFSHWSFFHNMRPGREPESFPSVICGINKHDFNLDKFNYEGDYIMSKCPMWGNYIRTYLETGCYSHYIKNFMLHFENVHFVVFEDLKQNKEDEFDRLLYFLGAGSCNIDMRNRNVNAKKYEMQDVMRLYLRRFYKDWVYETSLLTKIDLVSKWGYV